MSGRSTLATATGRINIHCFLDWFCQAGHKGDADEASGVEQDVGVE